jgi:hypothetical protein
VANHATQYGPGGRNDYSGEHWSEYSAQSHRSTHVPGEKSGNLGGEVFQVTGGNMEIFGTDYPVNESDSESQAVGVFEHTCQLLGAGINRKTLSFDQPFPHQGDGFAG